MPDDAKRKILLFTSISLLLATLLDVSALAFKMLESQILALAWGIARMWSVTLSAIIVLTMSKESVIASLKRTLVIGKKQLIYYLLAPLVVYLALGVYVALAVPTGSFDFNAYINVVYEALRRQLPTMPVETVRSLAVTAAYLEISVNAYIAALTINAFAAIGEELGWRGYLYQQLGNTPTLKNTLIIGTIWGLWHAPAILLLGYNYQANRLPGVLLFTLLCISLTYPLLLLRSHSGSLLPAASLHGAFNALWPLTLIATTLPADKREILLGLGVLGILSWTLFDIILHLTFKLNSRAR
mgnify:CR=1 FL=1